MDRYAELMQQLLDVQSGGRQRSPKLIEDDERLMHGLRERTLAEKSIQMKHGNQVVVSDRETGRIDK